MQLHEHKEAVRLNTSTTDVKFSFISEGRLIYSVQERRLTFTVGYSKLEMNAPGVYASMHSAMMTQGDRLILSAECHACSS